MLKKSLERLSILGVVSCLGLAVSPPATIPAIAQSSPILAQTQPDATSPLLGEWRFSDPDTEETITIIFAPEDRVFFILPDSEGSAIAVQMGYQVNTNAQPLQLDVIANPDERALTVFELTPDGKLRLDLDVQPGEPRPEQIGENAIVFDRVSDATQPPANLQVIDLTAAAPPEPAIPVQFLAILLRGQQAYYLENGEFAANVEDLGLATTLETEEYRYQIQPEGNSSETIAIAAIPKNEGLPSYAGAVFVLPNNGDKITIAGICQSDNPSMLPPIPLAPSTEARTIQCPSGSSVLE